MTIPTGLGQIIAIVVLVVAIVLLIVGVAVAVVSYRYYVQAKKS